MQMGTLKKAIEAFDIDHLQVITYMSLIKDSTYCKNVGSSYARNMKQFHYILAAG